MRLGSVALGEVEEIGVSRVDDGHDTGKQRDPVSIQVLTEGLLITLTRRGRAFQQQFQEQHWFQQSGER